MNKYYKSRYKKTELLQKWHLILIKIIKVISKSRFKKILDPLDQMQVKFDEEEENFKELSQSKKEISLSRIEFIEAIEIDDIEIAENQIYKIIRENKFYSIFGSGKDLPQTRINEIKETFKKFRSNFKTWHTGTFFELVNENPKKSNDLYEYISFSYFKTLDNLLILKLDVHPSKKFHKYLERVRKVQTEPRKVIRISLFKDFLATKRMIAGYTVSRNLREKGFENLIFDLNYQIRMNFLKDMKGVFSSERTHNPYITYFNTDSFLNMEDLTKGFGIFGQSVLNTFFDQENGYYLIQPWTDNNLSLHVIGENNAFPSEFDQDKNIENYKFSSTIFKYWAISLYLNKLNKDLNSFRKEIYSFINSSNYRFKKQVNLKTDLSKRKIRFQRIEREFDKKKIDYFLKNSRYDISRLRAINNSRKSTSNFYQLIKSNILYNMEDGDQQITDLDIYFKEISSINLLRLNYNFQVIAILLAALGIILAFANIDDIIRIANKILN